ncbi:hypothetical protein ACIQNU_04210 [Streptomyces sp. NPDC091292]|uniref:hypothetical protein n=1 Tax=Streptomyces sp. NPDC091292 TaxID=3365991 RepID=UPI0037FD9B1A
MSRTEGKTRAERRENVRKLRKADAALHANQRREQAAGIDYETPEYERLNLAANQAADKVSRWRGGNR